MGTVLNIHDNYFELLNHPEIQKRWWKLIEKKVAQVDVEPPALMASLGHTLHELEVDELPRCCSCVVALLNMVGRGLGLKLWFLHVVFQVQEHWEWRQGRASSSLSWEREGGSLDDQLKYM